MRTLLPCFAAGFIFILPTARAQTGPSIARQPASQTNLAGATATLTIAVSGNGPFTYQWQFNGTGLPNLITTVAGASQPGYSGDEGGATDASLSTPAGVAVDSSGNLFIADARNNRIRKVDTNGIITTLAGRGPGGYAGDGGLATNALLDSPSGVAVDASGNVFIGDYYNNRVRKVSSNGVITTVAGNGFAAYTGDGGAATNASLSYPVGVAVDGAGNLFIADSNNNSIRKVDVNGAITTVAGNGASAYSGDGGASTNASLAAPSGVAVDGSGNLFITDSNNNRIRKVDINGIIITVAGNGFPGDSGDGGAATNASLGTPFGLAVDGAGNLFIADSGNNRVRNVDADGVITTVAGSRSFGYSGDGGAATNASLSGPSGVAVDSTGLLFVADSGNNRIREVALAGFPALTLADLSAADGGAYRVVITSAFGSVTSAVAIVTVLSPPFSLTQPANVAVAVGGAVMLGVEAAGTSPLSFSWYFEGTNLVEGATNSTLILDSVSLAGERPYRVVITNAFGSVTSEVAFLSVGFPPSITKEPVSQTNLTDATATLSVAVSGTGPFTYQWQFNGTTLPNLISTAAGNGSQGYFGDAGAATNASLSYPVGVAVDGSGNLFIADEGNSRVRKMDTNGIIVTVAGNGSSGYSGDGGVATKASLGSPTGVVFDAFGRLFIADPANNRVREVDTRGIITTVAGNGFRGYSGDGGPATNASLNLPQAVAVDGSGNLFIADAGNNRVRKVGPNGVIQTVAGTGSIGYFGDGGGAKDARLRTPSGLAIDASANLFIADEGNNRVRKVDPTGVITTVAGDGTAGFSGDGAAATNVSLHSPSAVAVDFLGNLYIADTGNGRVRKVDANGIITSVAGNGSPGYSGDGEAATNAGLCAVGVAVDGSGNLFVADDCNQRIREVHLSGLPMLTFSHVSVASAGNYQVVVTSPYGSATSVVASLTVVSPSGGNPGILMNAPRIDGSSLVLGFRLTQGASVSYALLQSPGVTGPWTINQTAVLTTNVQAGGYLFTLPVPVSNMFYEVRTP